MLENSNISFFYFVKSFVFSEKIQVILQVLIKSSIGFRMSDLLEQIDTLEKSGMIQLNFETTFHRCRIMKKNSKQKRKSNTC